MQQTDTTHTARSKRSGNALTGPSPMWRLFWGCSGLALAVCIGMVVAVISGEGRLGATQEQTVAQSEMEPASNSTIALPPVQRFPVKRCFRRADSLGREDKGKAAEANQTARSTSPLPSPPPCGTESSLPKKVESPQAVYRSALHLLHAEQTQAARERLRTFLNHYADHSLASNARYWLGETWYSQQAYTKAIAIWNDALQRRPDSHKAPAMLLKIGYARFELGQKDKGRLSLQCLLRTDPPSRIAALARKKLAEGSCDGHS